LTFSAVFNIIGTFRLAEDFSAAHEGDNKIMSYAIIKTGGKQFPVETGQKLRVPTIEGKEGGKVDIDALFVNDGKKAEFGASTVKATIVGHGKGAKVIVFKKKRRKQYKRKQGHRQGFTEITIDKI
jgi:large subunit ribosomal protein L21